VHYHKNPEWINRKYGKLVILKRRDDEGRTIGCGHPCVSCRKALEKFNLKVITIVSDETMEVYSGPIKDAPPSKPTVAQSLRKGWARPK